MIHCCQSRDPLLQTHSANPFLSTGTCIKRIQFSFSVQVQFSSIRKLFLCKKKSWMSFVIYPFDSLKPFPRFHSWNLWLEPILWSGNQFSEVQIGWFEQSTSTVLGGRQACRPMWTCYSWTSGTSGPLEWARCSLAGWLHFTMVSLNNMSIKLE